MTTTSPFHIALLGASKGIANQVLHNLLGSTGATATLLLRKPQALDGDSVVAEAVAAGRVKIVQGDATVEADVERAVAGADVVLTSVGGTPSFTLRGFQLDNPTLCTDAALTLLRVLQRTGAQPRVVAVSSMGIGQNHGIMPLAMRILYSSTLSGPHADKEGMEYLLLRAGTFATAPPPPPTSILAAADRDAVPAGMLPELILVRPALLTDGAEGSPVRAGEDVRCYTISRKDVARWITDNCMPGAGAWVNRAPVLGY